MIAPRFLPSLVLAGFAQVAAAQPVPTAPTAPPDPPDQAAQAAQPSPTAPAAADLPVSLERVRRGLAREDAIARAAAREGWRPMFRVEVDAELPSFASFLAEGERLSGPVPWGGLTHSEFLNMVTPPQARAFGASTNGDLLQVLATSLAGAYAMQGVSSLARAVPGIIRRGREAAARREVRLVLEALERRQEEEAARAREADEQRRKAAAAGLVPPPD